MFFIKKIFFQVNIWSVSVGLQAEECLGSAQVSLADFDLETPVSLKWFNVLSFHFMLNDQKVRKMFKFLE
jgi:hypothetical protein